MKLTLIALTLILPVPILVNSVAIADLLYGQTATVTGTVQNIPDEDEFRIKDASGAILVYIGPNIVPFDVGETITVTGRVDREMGQLELYARNAVRTNGTKFSFDHHYE